jgi:hypothetical protein
VRSAAIGALAAAMVTGILGYFGVYQQIKAEDARAMKERQQEAYSALISDERTLDRLEEDFFLMYAGSRRPAAELTAQKARIDEAYLKLSQDVSNVGLIGSNTAAITALDIDARHAYIRAVAFGAEVSATFNIRDEETVKKFADSYF